MKYPGLRPPSEPPKYGMHMLHGSRSLGRLVEMFYLPQITQVGFGESFLQTLLADVAVKWLPSHSRKVTFENLRYRRNGSLWFHSSIYSDPAVIATILNFISSDLTDKPEPAMTIEEPTHADPDLLGQIDLIERQWEDGPNESNNDEPDEILADLFAAGTSLSESEALDVQKMLASSGVITVIEPLDDSVPGQFTVLVPKTMIGEALRALAAAHDVSK